MLISASDKVDSNVSILITLSLKFYKLFNPGSCVCVRVIVVVQVLTHDGLILLNINKVLQKWTHVYI